MVSYLAQKQYFCHRYSVVPNVLSHLSEYLLKEIEFDRRNCLLLNVDLLAIDSVNA